MADEGDSAPRSGKTPWSAKGIAQIVVIVVVIAAGIYFARAPSVVSLEGRGATGGRAAGVSVNVVRPVRASATLDVRTTGVVTVRGGVTIRSQAAGEVVFVSPSLRSGSAFRAGEVLLRVDPSPFEIRVESAKAAVREAQARLRKQQLKGEFKAQEFRRQNPDVDVPALVRRVPQIERAQARVERAENGLKNAEFALSQTSISLPFDGWVRAAGIEVGQIVGPTVPLGQVFAKDAVQFEAQAALRDLRSLEPVVGRAAKAVTQGGRTFDVVVERVSPVVDPQSRQATLYMAFANDGERQASPRPGTFVNVVVPGPPVDDVFVLPEAAEQSGGSVWLVEEDALQSFQPRSLGRNSAGWVVQAFDAKQGVVVGRLAQPRSGMAVKPVAAARP